MHRSTNLQKARRFRFLRSVLWLGFTAFGGPQMHLPYFKKYLVDKWRFLTQEELIEINAFCSALPGPSTTQTITTIGLKLGGNRLAIQTLILWALPGALIMTILAISPRFIGTNELRFMGPTVLGFMAYGTISMFRWIEKTRLHLIIFFISGIGAFLIQSPWIYPISMIIVGIIGAKWGTATTTKSSVTRTQINWRNLLLFVSIFVIVGISGLALSNSSRDSKWGKPIVLFENTYRMSALSLGGGHVLAAMTVEQYVHHRKRLDMNQLNAGIGLIHATPGPNFNLATYTNAKAMKNAGYGYNGQMLGALIGLIAVFLPGTLFVFFAFPIWEKIKNIGFLQRSVPALFALSVGFILSATLSIGENAIQDWIQAREIERDLQLALFGFTLLSLWSQRIPSPFIVVFSLTMGWVFSSSIF